MIIKNTWTLEMAPLASFSSFFFLLWQWGKKVCKSSSGEMCTNGETDLWGASRLTSCSGARGFSANNIHFSSSSWYIMSYLEVHTYLDPAKWMNNRYIMSIHAKGKEHLRFEVKITRGKASRELWMCCLLSDIQFISHSSSLCSLFIPEGNKYKS